MVNSTTLEFANQSEISSLSSGSKSSLQTELRDHLPAHVEQATQEQSERMIPLWIYKKNLPFTIFDKFSYSFSISY